MALALASLLAAAPAYAIDPFTFGNKAFCSPSTPVRDFGLSELPPVPQVPDSGAVFGHGAVSIYGGGFYGQVMPRPQEFGYGFSENNYSGTVKLDWTVTAQLWRVDRDGVQIEEVDSDTLSIGRLNAAHQPGIYLTPPNRRGFYRFDIQFAGENGGQLGSYGAYFKLARPFWKARLGLSGKRFHAGQRVLSRVENLGTEMVSFGEEFGVQRREGGGWAHVPDATQGIWFMWLGAVGAGWSGRCSSLYLSEDFTPGLYRIVKEVGPSPWPRGKRSYHLTAPFEVVG